MAQVSTRWCDGQNRNSWQNARVHIVVAVNPNASFGKHPGLGAEVTLALSSRGHNVDMVQCESFEECVLQTRQALQQRPDALVVVGGDGMVSLGVNALANRNIPLGIVAAGTGNDMARGLGLPFSHPDASLRALLLQLHQPPRTIDLARATSADGTSRWFGCVLSAGFDAIVNERANRMRRPRGRSRYILALLLELATLRTRTYRLEVDGQIRTERAVLVAVGNNTSLGGGMTITPNADLNDGLLNMVIGKHLTRLQLLRLFPKVFSGRHMSHPAVEEVVGRHIVVDTDDVIAYADGERLGPLPVTIDVQPASLLVFAP